MVNNSLRLPHVSYFGVILPPPASFMTTVGENAPTSGLHALVVEDDMLIMMDIEEILKSLGISRVSCATNNENALILLESDTPDFALMDYHLGKANSLDLAWKLHNHHVPFAFVTGAMAPQTMPKEFANVPLVAKPFTESDIGMVVKQLLAKRQMDCASS